MLELFTSLHVKELVYPLLVAAPRIFGFWIAFPLFGQNAVPMMLRNGVAIAIALFAWPMLAGRMPNPMPALHDWFFIVPKELALGFGLGAGLGITVWALESAGTLIDTQSGTNNAAQMDPTAGAPLGPTGGLLRQYALVLLLTSGGLVEFVLLLVRSFDAWPWHAAWPDARGIAQALFDRRAELYWALCVRFVAPVALALLLLEFGLGLVNRSTPQFDVYRIGMPLKNLLAAVALAMVASFWAEALLALYREDARLLGEAFGVAVRPTR
jgi:type III secretion protein T